MKKFIAVATILLAVAHSVYAQEWPKYEQRQLNHEHIISRNEGSEIFYNGEWVPRDVFEISWGINTFPREGFSFLRDPQTRHLIPLEESQHINFYFRDADLREEYTLHPLEAEEMFRQSINRHRFDNELFDMPRMQSASLSAIHHATEMRDRQFSRLTSYSGMTHQQRMDLFHDTTDRQYIRSAHVSSHNIQGQLNQEQVDQIVDRLMEGSLYSWIINGYHNRVGIGVGIQEDGRLRLAIHMFTDDMENAQHYHRTYITPNREEGYARHTFRQQEAFRHQQQENLSETH